MDYTLYLNKKLLIEKQKALDLNKLDLERLEKIHETNQGSSYYEKISLNNIAIKRIQILNDELDIAHHIENHLSIVDAQIQEIVASAK